MKLRWIWAVVALWALSMMLLVGCKQQAEEPHQVSDPLPQTTVLPSPVPVQTPEAEVPLTPSAPAGPAEEEEDYGTAMTEKELEEWEAWLNTRTVCELFAAPFEHPGEVSLHHMFYDGVDEGNGYASDEEIAALEALRGTIHTDVTKVTVTDIINTFYRTFGVELTRKEIRNRLEYWIYLEEYDAYYDVHGDTEWRQVTCLSGELHPEDATLLLICEVDGQTYTVGLSENKDGAIIDYIRWNEN